MPWLYTMVVVSSIHPLSIEAISPTAGHGTLKVDDVQSIHPLSIEAISPTGAESAAER